MDIKKFLAKLLIALTLVFPATEVLCSCAFDPTDPSATERELFQEKKEMIDNFVSQIDKNFEISVYYSNKENKYKTFINENFVKQIRPYPNGNTIYISKEDNNDYVYNLDDNGNYHKSKLSTKKNRPFEEYLQTVHDFVNSFSWTVYYDKQNNLLVGEAEYNMRIPITASITEEELVINIMNEVVVFNNINKVTETLPEEWIDDTDKEEEFDKEAFDKEKAKFDSFFSRIHEGLNFRWRVYNDEYRKDLAWVAYFNNNFVKVAQNKPNVNYDDERWYSKENGENYIYYKDENGDIHKKIAEESDITFDDVLSLCLKIENAEFKSYEDGRLKGYFDLENGDKQELEVYVADDGIEIYINDQDWLIGGIGWIEEKLPEEFILDKVDEESNLLTEQTDFEALESDKVTEAEWDAAFTNEAFAGVTVKNTRGEMEILSKFGYEANSDGFDFSIEMDSTYKGTPYFSQKQIAHVVGDVATLYSKNLDDPDDENIYFMTQDLSGEDGVVMKEWSLTYRFGVSYDFAGAFDLFEYDETLHAYTYNGSDLKCKYSPMEAMGGYTVEKATLKFIGGKLAYAKVKITLDSKEEVFRYFDYGKTQVVIPENALPYDDATN